MPYPTGGSVIQPMGSSPEQIHAEVVSMGADIHIVLDDPKPIRDLQAAGATIIFRLAADDHAHERYDAVSFVAMLDALAPSGAWLHLGNEPGRGSLDLLNTWTLAALKECRRRGRIGVAFNFSTGEPETEEWRRLAPSLDYIIATGQWAGVHEYFLHTIARGIADGHVGRCRVLRALYPTLNIILTEVGMVTGLNMINGVWMYNPTAGWQAGSSAREVAEQLTIGIQTVWAPLNAPVTNFLEGHSEPHVTFDTRGQTVIFQALNAVNRTIRAGGQPMEGWKTLTITSGSSVVNVRALPSTGGKILLQAPSGTRLLLLNQRVTAGGHTWQALDLGSQTAWIALSVCRFA